MDGRIIVSLVVALGALAEATPARAQGREQKRYAPSSPEGKLMLYYSSTVAFSPLGIPPGAERSSMAGVVGGGTTSHMEVAVELSYLPPLSAEQRTAGSDKPESTNLAPMFVRPRLGARLPGGFGLELSWIPPVRVFDVKANLVAGALSRSFGLSSEWRLVPRVSVLTGRVEGPITCNRETATDGGAALAVYYSLVCYGNDSRDFFEPRHVSGELLLAHEARGGRWRPYVSVGARAERTRFDVGVIRPDGTRDPDEPVLRVHATRGYGAAGASWLGLRRTRFAAELYYAPGSVLTGRALAGITVW